MTAEASRLERASLSTPRIVRSEWIKLRTLRSTWWCGIAIVVLAVLFALLIASFVNRDGVLLPTAQQDDTTVRVVTVGTNFTQLIAAVLGVLVISGEYGTGMIRSTFTAVPTRLPAVLAKLGVLAAAMFVLGILAALLAVGATAGILSSHHITPHPFDPAVWMPIVGSAVYLALVAVLAFAIGALLRSTAGGIATALGLLLVLPIIVNIAIALTQARWLENIGPLLPAAAGGQLYAYAGAAAAAPGPGARGGVASADVVLNGWAGVGVLAAWIVVALVPALILVRRRDA